MSIPLRGFRTFMKRGFLTPLRTFLHPFLPLSGFKTHSTALLNQNSSRFSSQLLRLMRRKNFLFLCGPSQSVFKSSRILFRRGSRGNTVGVQPPVSRFLLYGLLLKGPCINCTKPFSGKRRSGYAFCAQALLQKKAPLVQAGLSAS